VFSFIRYSIEGHLIAVETAKGNVFHICNISDMIADAAWSFGTRLKNFDSLFICKNLDILNQELLNFLIK